MKNFSEWLKEKLLESDMTYSKALSILGIDKDQELTTDFLEKRYRDLSLKNHPDKGGSNDSFIKIHNAFVYLKENPKRNKRSEIMKIYPTISKIFDKTWEKSTILSTIEKFFLKTQKDRLLKRGYLEEETIKNVEKYLDKVYTRGTLHIEMASKNFYEMLKIMEMPLAHYGYKFNLPNDPDEKYNTKTGSQYSLKPLKAVDPWGGETETLEKSFLGPKFSSRDKKLISHPRTMKVLENKLKNSKFNFNILLIEYKEHNVEYVRHYQDMIENYLKENNINQSNSITFAKNSTTGHILTPWMVLHTLGHALMQAKPDYEPDIRKSLDKIYDIIQYNGIGENLPSWPWGVAFEFKSVKEFKVDDVGELIHELVAEYLWNGKIRINSMTSNIKEIVDEIKNIENTIVKVLESCVGSIIYDAN